MKAKFGFYIAGEKGLFCLKSIIKSFGHDCILFVNIARDENMLCDYYDDILNLCNLYKLRVDENNTDIIRQSDMNFAIGWRRIIKDYKNLVVFHDSLLPKYRGFAPLVNSLINGEGYIGVTALFASAEYDTGPVVGQRRHRVDYPVKIANAIQCISKLYAELLVEICTKIVSGAELKASEQCEQDASYSPWRDEHDYMIDWKRDSQYIKRFIDAVGYPYKGASTLLNGNLVRVHDVSMIDDVDVVNRLSHIGKVLFMKEGAPIVICGSGLLRINKISWSDGTIVDSLNFRTRFGV